MGCDHGVTFHEDDKLRTVLWQWAGKTFSENEVLTLQKLQNRVKENQESLISLITINEFDALVDRIERLISESQFPVPSDEWPAVPWPPF